MSDDEPKAMTLAEIIEGFLSIAILHPEKPPKTQRAERDNSMLILGYNRAQEQLRSILAAHGDSNEVRALAEVRSEGQQRPMDGLGGVKVWVAG